MEGLSEIELGLIAEDIANSCRDVAERVEVTEDDDDIIVCRWRVLCDQIAYKLTCHFDDGTDDEMTD